eukprot:scaffold22791_cov142-Cylindrotheca_fusiformis.AAC.1
MATVKGNKVAKSSLLPKNNFAERRFQELDMVGTISDVKLDQSEFSPRFIRPSLPVTKTTQN